MNILAVDTAGKTAGVALLQDDRLLYECYLDAGMTHSETILPLIDNCLKFCHLTCADIDVYGVNAGPGSFTGLRIGVSALKGLAWALEKPCCGVSTLAAMARNLAHMEGIIVCAMDARRDQVYNALFLAHDGILSRQCPDRAISLAELSEELKNRPEPKFIVGDGAKLCYTYLLEQDIPCRMAPPQLVMQNAVGVALAAEEMSANGQTTTARDLVPVYLRLSQAERERLARGLKITLDQ